MHRLLALYTLSEAILDSYPAGGCTTTREALALGAPVVTLPHKYLGSRWSAAYYEIIGVTELIARDEDEYVRLAVRLGTDASYRAGVQARIRDSVHKLYRRDEAVDAWTALLTRLAEDGTAAARDDEEEEPDGFLPASRAGEWSRVVIYP